MAFHGAATETNKLISPKQFETFSLPYLQRINSRADRAGHRQLLHPHLRRAEQEPQVLAAGAHDQADGDQRRPRGRPDDGHGDVPQQIIAGNVDPTLIQEGRAEEVLAQARECIEKAKDHKGGFILMAGCDVPPHAPPVNVFQLVKAAREYGRY